GAQSANTVVGKVDANRPLRQENDEQKQNAESLIMRMGEATAASGDKVCLPVETTGFKNLIGFQFTMRFDSAALKFQSLRQMGLPGYTVGNFGLRFADRGYVSSLWSDGQLQGKTLPPRAKLFEICFTNLMEKGQSTEVKFQDGPTAFEVIREDMAGLRFVYANGAVKCE
ncbi:MAG: hypothetical protein AAGA31_04765, partial [Bacteroidota bacterium]